MQLENYNLLSNIRFWEELLEKVYYKYINKEGKPIEIRISETEKSLLNFSNNSINQYYDDGTYKVIPDIDNIYAFIIIIGFNYNKNLFELCLVACLGVEKEASYYQFYWILKNNYIFSPKYLTYDFLRAHIKAVTNIYKNESKIITCFFHYIKCLWRKANSLHLRNKNYI